jgi:hypothetical protein
MPFQSAKKKEEQIYFPFLMCVPVISRRYVENLSVPDNPYPEMKKIHITHTDIKV